MKIDHAHKVDLDMIRWLFFLIPFFPSMLLSQSWNLDLRFSEQAPRGSKFTPIPGKLCTVFRSSEDLSLEEVMRRSAFAPSPDPLYIQHGEAIWMHAACVNGEDFPVRYLFELDHVFTDQHFRNITLNANWSEVSVYIVSGDSSVQQLRTDNNQLAKDKPIRDARNLFWLDFDSGEQKQLYIRLKSQQQQERPALSMRIVDHGDLRELEGLNFDRYHIYSSGKFHGVPHSRAFYSLEYVADSTGLDFAQVLSHWDEQAYFGRKQDLEMIKQHMVWCRFTLINPDSNDSRYHIIDVAGDAPLIEVYLPQGDGKYRMVKTGKKVTRKEKTIDHPLNLFEHTIGPGDTAQIFVKCHPIVNDKGFMISMPEVGLYLHDPVELMTTSKYKALWKGFIAGIFLFQLLYFLLRSLLERNTLGLYYAMITLGFGFLFLGLENFQNTFYALQVFLYQTQSILVLSLLTIAVGLFLFTDQYLGLRSFWPEIYRFQRVLLVLIALAAVAHIVQCEFWHLIVEDSLFFRSRFFLYLSALFGLALLSFVIAVVRAYCNGIPDSGNYLLAFTPFILGIVLLQVNFIFLGRRTDLLFNLLYLGFLLTSVLFAVIGARRHNELKTMEAQAKNLIKLDKAKSEFFDNITHEFRTPLTVVMGLVGSIKGHSREKDLIKKNSQELLGLVDQLLDLSKSNAGLLELKLSDNNIVLYLEYLIESFQALADQKEIDLRFISDEDEVIMAYDREKIKFIITNLVSNAIKFTPRKGKVLVQTRKENGALSLDVRDTGVGLTPQDQEKIFDRFYQVESARFSRFRGGDSLPTSEVRRGTGIGLALVSDVVRLLDGTIKMDSKPNKGTSFHVKLPLYPSRSASASADVSETAGAEITSGKPLFISSENENIALVVEDNEDVQFYIEGILSAQYKVLKAYDGKEGLDIAIETIPDIIICDVMMPKMDGYELTVRLKEDPRTNHVPVILLTAKAGQSDKVKGLTGGADAYLTKPFHEEELKVRMDKLIQSRQRLRERYTQEHRLKTVVEQEDPFLKLMSDVLEEHYSNEDFGIKELVNAIHLSRMQVHRKLKALTGYSTSQYLNDYRLEKGKELLVDQQLNIAEVAYSCGFGDPGYFSKLFSKKYGKSPQAFRKNITA